MTYQHRQQWKARLAAIATPPPHRGNKPGQAAIPAAIDPAARPRQVKTAAAQHKTTHNPKGSNHARR